MIISHRHRFIFLKRRKTAGTSLELALSEHCGPDDLITAVSPEDEATRRTLGFPGPQNHFINGREVMNHHPASIAMAIVGPDKWSSYYKFTIERNPYDK